MILCMGSLSKRKNIHEFFKKTGLGDLETFWTKDCIEAAFTDIPNAWLIIDSGAHSFYTRNVKSRHGVFVSDFSWADSLEFKSYLESYISWLHENINKDNFEAYVVLDVIGDAKRTWDVQKYMESYGLNPLPVFHFGEDAKWLDKYIDNYEFFGVGGVAGLTSNNLFYDSVFRRIGRDSNGNCKRKIHGFGITDFKTMFRYPFYSVDSVSWALFAAYGWALLPKVEKGEFLFNQPIVVKTSTRPGSSASRGLRLNEYMKLVGGDEVKNYVKNIGIEFSNDDEFFQQLDNHWNRGKLNLHYFAQLQTLLSSKTDWAVWQKNQLKFVK